jgi:hypothetical protein
VWCGELTDRSRSGCRRGERSAADQHETGGGEGNEANVQRFVISWLLSFFGVPWHPKFRRDPIVEAITGSDHSDRLFLPVQFRELPCLVIQAISDDFERIPWSILVAPSNDGSQEE